MELPPCPNCGQDLQLEGPHGPAKCPDCAFVTPVEVNGEALGQLLEEASSRGLGPRPALAPAREAPEPRLEGRETPSMLDSAQVPEKPRLSPPPVPEELTMGAPPAMADPRAPMTEGESRAPPTELGASMEDREDDRKDRLKPRGELLR
jgi:hypothetical protein